MPSFLEISPEKLSRLIGTPGAPVIIDVRTEEDFALDPRLVPGTAGPPAIHASKPPS
ncbi:sulfurtransferase, partial [Rhizobium ruizarguesonis]